MASDANLTHDTLAVAFPGCESARCDGYGAVTVRMPGETYARTARCPVCQRQRLAAAVDGFIPLRFRSRIDVPAEVTQWARQGKQAEGLYVGGPVGTGKTHAAWEALRRWCMTTGRKPHDEDWDDIDRRRIRPSVVFTRMTDLLDSLRPGDDGTLRIADCQLAALLVLDDIGAEKASEWTQERIYSIIDHRYSHCLPLIVTSNLPPGELSPQVGERAASRLAEMCKTAVAMTGTDRRWTP